MTLRTRLLLAQLPLALSLVLLGVVSRQTIGSLDRNAQNILKDNHQSVLAAQRMREIADTLGRVALDQAEGRAQVMAASDPKRADFERELSFQESNITESGERELTARLRGQWRRFSDDWERLRTLPAPLAAETYFTTLERELVALDAAIDAITEVNQDAMVQKSAAAQRNAERMSGVMLAVTLAACLLGILASVYLTNRLTRPLWVLATAVRRLGQGDLAVRARLEGQDEIAQLAREFNTMADRLAEYRSSSLGELLQAQHSSQAAIDSLPDPVLVLQGPSLVNVNRAAEEQFQIAIEAAQQSDPFARAPAEVRAVVTRVREHLAAGRGAYVPRGLEDAVAVRVRETTRYYLARANPVLGEDGQVVGSTILFQDVTRLRRFDELKTDMVATVAHEFRTPLTSLRMALHLCLEGAVGPLNEKQNDLLFAARDDCERLQGIVDDLLDLSRIQAGRIELHTRPVSSTALLQQAVDAQRMAAADKSVSLTVAATAVDRQLLADPDRVQLVLSNLVQNALRHTAAGGHVELGATLTDADTLRISVRDDGSGIGGEHQARLFERFSRVPGGVPGGAGLGLYISKEIVEAHGGRIGVKSAPGRGSTFWLTLPLARADAG